MKETTRTRKNRPSALTAAGRAAFAAFAAAVMIGASSCKKESSEGAAPAAGGYFTAVTQPHTGDGKTYLDGTQVKWTGNESVKIFNGQGGSCDFTAAMTGDGTTANLATGADFAYVGPYFAVYPASGSFNNDGGTSSITDFQLSGTQAYKENGFAEGANPMAAHATPAEEDNSVTLGFENLCGLLRFELTGHGEVVKEIVITAADGDAFLSGAGTISLDNSGKPVLDMTGGSNKVTLDCGSGVTLTPTKTQFNVLLPPVAMTGGFSMEIVNDADAHVCTKYVTSTVNIVASTIYNVTSNNNPLDILPRDLSYHAEDSKTESANCYIVPGAGLYMFPCNVKGNGRVPEGPCFTYLSEEQRKSSIAVGKGYTAVPEWQIGEALTSVNGVNDPNAIVTNVELVGNHILFRATGKPGNALIALKDGTTIVWSWHIWYPKTAIGEATGNGCTLMDRNLGALTANEAKSYNAGFLYQWGRKDPLFGAADYMTNTGTQQNFMNNASNETIEVDATESTNLENSIKNPTTFIKSKGNAPYDWFTTNNTDLTVDTYHSNGLWAEDKKTMFDPCPYGWKVAQNGAFGSGVIVPAAVGTTNGWAYRRGGSSPTLGSDKGLNFNGYYFPATGGRLNGSGGLDVVGGVGYFWSCSPYSTTPRNACYLTFYSAEVYPESNNYRASGFSVRPVQEW